ncbi:MAG: flagellar P-ring protein [Fibrobacterota bacterium]|jgi:flagellar P-ring protein precursor FlgI
MRWFDKIRQILPVLLLAGLAQAQVRIKDVAQVQGLTDLQLVGYGIVVGLPGTGDGSSSMMTVQSVRNMLRNLGLEVEPKQIRMKNVAAVMVTARLSPFSKPGTRMDVLVSSLGDAKSLSGGTLLMTPLRSADEEVYVLAQGPVGTGGSFSQESGGASTKQNISSTGILPLGGIIQRENPANRLDQGQLRFALTSPDFSTAAALAEAIRKEFGTSSAAVEDAATVRFEGAEDKGGRAALIARIENLRLQVSRSARVVINERTGTIVAGSEVRLQEVAVTHGSLTIKVDPGTAAVQPNGFSIGTTATIQNPRIDAQEGKNQMRVIPQNANVGELAQALNAMGVTPRDLIAILQAIQRAGALQADLVVM